MTTLHGYLRSLFQRTNDNVRANAGFIGDRIQNVIEANELALLDTLAADFPILDREFSVDRMNHLLGAFSVYAYPNQSEFLSSAMSVLAHLQGADKSKQLAHDAYVCVGFGLAKFVGDPTATSVAMPMSSEPLTDVQVFEQAVASCKMKAGTDAVEAMPPGFWAKLIAAALSILQQFFPVA